MSHEHIDVSYVAKLARLDLTDEEVKTFQLQLDSILGHVETLTNLELPDDLDLDGIDLLGMMRDDQPLPSLPAEAVLNNAPDQAQSQIRVPKVVSDA